MFTSCLSIEPHRTTQKLGRATAVRSGSCLPPASQLNHTNSYKSTYTHTHTHIHTHAHAHAHTHILSLSHTHQTGAARRDGDQRRRWCVGVREWIDGWMCVCVCVCVYVRARACVPMPQKAKNYKLIHTPTHTHTHTPSQPLTHPHTHTCARAVVESTQKRIDDFKTLFESHCKPDQVRVSCTHTRAPTHLHVQAGPGSGLLTHTRAPHARTDRLTRSCCIRTHARAQAQGRLYISTPTPTMRRRSRIAH